jgi:SNF2 family DNA or RNA helicase
MGRIHNMLRLIMLRRTHVDTLFNAPTFKLPGLRYKTHKVEFNAIERNIYNMVKSRYIAEINSFSSTRGLAANYNSVLGMLIRLRMLCSHVMLCQSVLKSMFKASDIENLWRLTAKEVQANGDTQQQNMIKTLRKMLANNENVVETFHSKTIETVPRCTPDLHDFEEMN